MGWGFSGDSEEEGSRELGAVRDVFIVGNGVTGDGEFEVTASGLAVVGVKRKEISRRTRNG